MDTEPRGCLALLFGFGVKASGGPSAPQGPGAGEGNIHSGPGGYEDASYEGGYAADYFGGENDEH